MNTILLFLIKSILVSGLLTCWYFLALRGKKLHYYNRFFLLFTLYVSIQLPLLHFNWFTASGAPARLLSPTNLILRGLDDNVSAVAQPVSNAIFTSIDWTFILSIMVFIISAVLLCTLLIRIIWIINLRRKYKCSLVEGIELIHTDLPRAPFSFLSWIFWKGELSPETGNGKLIFVHELTHIRQGHTYDKLACQVMTCIFWMNPFYWLIQKEMNMVHEFIADEAALATETTPYDPDMATETFAKMLLQTHNNGSYLTPEHQFFSSPIKRRLIMLHTNKKTSNALLRRMGVLPLVAGSLLIFSFSPKKAISTHIIKADKKIVLMVDAGHGGNDLGTTLGSLKEKDLNLKVCRRINELAPEYNIEVHLVRDKDEYVSLVDRVKISNNLHPDYFISIHVNNVKGSDSNKGTFEIDLDSKNLKAESAKAVASRKLAYAMYRNMVRPGWEQVTAASEKSLHVLRENTVPAILIELGDIKNQAQMAQLNDNTTLDELCAAILRGVVDAHKD